jgi:hypothetical protein
VRRSEPPPEEDLRNRRNVGNRHVSGDLVIESWSTDAGRFDASPDRVNEWTIALPEKLINDIRAKLRAEKTTTPD